MPAKVFLGIRNVNLPDGRNDRHDCIEYCQKVKNENIVGVLLI
jgi:hypothetical protein